MSQNPLNPDEVESLLATRQELGPAMEPALVESFAEKIIAEVQRQTYLEHQRAGRNKASNGAQLTLGIVSLVMAIPLTAIAFGNGYPWMVVVTWVGIVLVNFAFAMRRRDNS